MRQPGLGAILGLFMAAASAAPGGAAGGAQVVDGAFVADALKHRAIVWDVRSAEEYDKGHIPGAVNIPFEQNWVDPEAPKKLAKKEITSKDGLALKPEGQLEALYAELDPDKEIVVYCQSGVRASETATVLKDPGFRKVRVYDSSWLGYGNTLTAPAEDMAFFNVGAMKGQMAAMQKRIGALEKLAASAKTAK